MKKFTFYLFLIALLYSCSSETQNTVNTLNTNMTEFKWDFSKDQKISYSLEQEQTTITDFQGEGQFDSTHHSMNGKIILDIEKNSTMNFILDSLKGKTKYPSESFTQHQAQEMKYPKQIIPGFNEYGRNNTRPNQTEMLASLFPLPYGEKCDQSYYEIKTSMPFNAQGAALNVEGLRKITIKDSLEIKKHKCVKIEVETQFNKIEIPKGLEGEYFCKVTSSFWGYFDYEKGIYIEGHDDIQSRMLIKTDAPSVDGQLEVRTMEMVSFQKTNFTLDE